MVDISKCKGEGCIIKHACYRFTAPASLRQSYFSPPIEGRGENCKYKIDVHEKKEYDEK